MRYFKDTRILKLAFIIFAILLLVIGYSSTPPKDFPKQQFDFNIDSGDSIIKVAESLYEKNMISSKSVFKFVAIVLSGNKGVKVGDYRFSEPTNAIGIARRMINGEQRQPSVTVTIPEGTNTYDIAYILLKKLNNFNAARFVSLAVQYEGYLYPDTYTFLANAKPEEIIKVMRENFEEKISKINLSKSNRSLKDIVNMAAIVEKEANNSEDRKIIAGILWKRLDRGMLLQVDAPFYYLTGKPGNFTKQDLAIKSPYNTYIYKGLPKGPISNPGIAAIEDTVNSIKTDYYYYLTGKDGVMRYAITYDTHLNNINRYLK